MKRSLYLFCILFLNVTVFASSQNSKNSLKEITLSLGNVKLERALKEIRDISDVEFFYSDEELDVNRIVNVQFYKTNLVEAISTLVGGNYTVEDKGDGLFLIVPFVISGFQTTTVSGLVYDEAGMPLPGVTVLIKGERTGTTTNFDGQYKIQTNSDSVLVFSYIGFQTQEITVGDQTNINVKMKSDVSQLDEVVVTGIVQRNKETFTGAVNTISGDEIKEIGNLNVIQSIKTLDPSFIVLENNLQGSNPNVLPNIEVRGKTSVSTEALRDEFGADPNSPLFILDGFETDLRTIVDLDMNRVASITILKDAASTALYGSKAANGVVVVETKKPVEGKFRVTYTGDFNVDMPDLTDYNLMNASEKLEFERLSGRWSAGSTDPRGQAVLDSLYNLKLADVRRGVNTYWLSEPTRTAFSQRHSVYVDGGSEALRIAAGVNYKDGKGVMKGSGRKTWGGNIDLTYRKGKINITNRLYVNGYDADESPYGSFEKFAQANPYYTKRNAFGEITRYLDYVVNTPPGNVQVSNPLYSSTLNNIDNTVGFNIQNNLGAIWKFNKNLRLEGGLQLRKTSSKQKIFLSPEETEFDDSAFFERGEYTNTQIDNFSYRGNLMLVYNNVFAGKHMVNGNLRAEIEEQNNEAYTTKAVGFPYGANGNPAFAFSYDRFESPGYDIRKFRRNNVMASANYAYDNRYLLDLNYRLDGSTAFGSNEKYSPFWSAGLGWNIHNEFNFNKEVVNLLRIRQTLGYTGNQNLGSIASISVYDYRDLINYFGSGVGLSSFANPDLEWQRTFDMNLGLDMAFFNNRLDAQFNIYRKKTDPLVVPVNLVSSTGLVAYPLNVGYLQVDGFEAIVNYNVINNRKDRIIWRVGATTSVVNQEYGGFGNKLQNLDEDAIDSNSLRRFRDGASPDDIWAVPSLGIDPATGQEVFLKHNGQTTFDYDYDDEVVVGNLRPTMEGVLSTSFNYKAFNIGLNVRYRFGGQIFNSALYDKVENISRADINFNQDKRALYDRWQLPGDQSRFKAISLLDTTPISSRFVEDENVLIGESINVGYRVTSQSWVAALGLQSLRFTAYMNDIFRISTVDAERGIEYPFARTVSFSINASF
ncbi:SusC/RagA family TonB-linked outer membrane protein [Gaetbulibacter saemankumensis]|uniref:SusC/RagA family TonB-linked outer membrane protein n=1 Tax=Gaetbulibacter saemankumensis TaxID=311208 RepID=UPI00040C0788|nr:SusC/RagA family TonB-linked outer membrane protein [Gaetbulibacter saemankumensis]